MFCVGSKRSTYGPGPLTGGARIPTTPPTTPTTVPSSPPRSPPAAGLATPNVKRSAIVTMAEASVAERLLSLMWPPATAVVPCVLPRGAGDLAGVCFQHHVHHSIELTHRDGLRQDRPPGLLQEAVRARGEHVAGHEDDALGQRRTMTRDPLPDRLAVDVREPEVEHHDVVGIARERLQGRVTCRGRHRSMSLQREDLDEDRAKGRLVLDHEDVGGARPPAAAPRDLARADVLSNRPLDGEARARPRDVLDRPAPV